MRDEHRRLVADAFEELYKRYYDSRGDGDGQLDKLALGETDGRSLYIEYGDLYQVNPDAADILLNNPGETLAIAEDVLRDYDIPTGETIDANVRVGDVEKLPPDITYDVGDYPSDRMGELTRVRGQVTRVAQARGKLLDTAWECLRCGTINRVPDGSEPHECQGCDRQGPWNVDWSQSETTDYQLVRVQRPPEKAKSGAQADTLDVALEEDLVGNVSPGDRVDLATVLEPEIDDEESGTFELNGNAVSLQHQETDYDDLDIEQYEDDILELANSENPLQLVIDSIKPTHQGHEDIKQAIALQMFGGVRKELPDGSKKRGQSHILLIGDPGCDKSGLLEYAKRLSPRSVYTSGKNATSAGLTCAAVQTDFGDGGWTLEAGALVQAHRGLCAIDEFDKMDDDDRSGVQEALSQGTISPSKAGISNVTLPAQTTVLAAANPKHGRFDPYESIGEQIDLDPTLISRFDLIFTLKDQPDEETDAQLAGHLNDVAQAGQRIAAGEEVDDELKESVEPAIQPDLLRHYIAYAKQNCTPVMTEGAKRRFKEFYVNTRVKGTDEDSPVPITARKIEALHRLGEAMARVRLSNRVTEDDAVRVVELVRDCLEDVGVDPESGQMDADVVESGVSKAQRDRMQAIKDVVGELALQNESGAPVDDVIDKMLEEGYAKHMVERSIDQLSERGELYRPREDHLRTT